MCGIVGAIAERNVTPILLEGLRRLEYRGYDSAGIVTLDSRDQCLHRTRTVGKVQALAERLRQESVRGPLGIAHTRWATHGEPSERNAHPHVSNDSVAVVHNGIVENYRELKEELIAAGYRFESDTDTEVVAHLIDRQMRETDDLLAAVQQAVVRLTGAYSLGVICRDDPERLIAARAGSPLVLGIGIGEHFIASDVFALAPVTQTFVFLEEGDVADVRRETFTLYDREGQVVERPLSYSGQMTGAAGKGGYRHFMLKEIFEQPAVVAETLEGRIHQGRLLDDGFGPEAATLFDQVQGVHIIACGTSYHAGLVARYWLENLGVPCAVEVASEYRYRRGSDATGYPVRQHLSVWGNRRYPGGAARGSGARLSIHSDHLQRRRKLAGAGVGADPADPGRAGNRRGVHQGVHDATGGVAPAGLDAGPAARPERTG